VNSSHYQFECHCSWREPYWIKVVAHVFTDKILETLASPDVMDKIVPVLAEKIGEAQTPLIEDEIKKCIETHVDFICNICISLGDGGLFTNISEVRFLVCLKICLWVAGN
jgi:hypothetical protein